MHDSLPRNAIPSAWNLIETLGKKGRLRIAEAIFDEYKNEDNKPWFEERKDDLYQPYTASQLACLGEIAVHCPAFIDVSKPGPDADQPLVALAMSINDERTGCWASGPAVVVTHEKRTKVGHHRLKIPDACDFFDVEVMDLYQMIRREGPI